MKEKLIKLLNNLKSYEEWEGKVWVKDQPHMNVDNWYFEYSGGGDVLRAIIKELEEIVKTEEINPTHRINHIPIHIDHISDYDYEFSYEYPKPNMPKSVYEKIMENSSKEQITMLDIKKALKKMNLDIKKDKDLINILKLIEESGD